MTASAGDFITLERLIGYGYSLFMTVLYFRDRRVVRPYYAVLSKNLIRGYTSIVPKIEVRLGGEVIPNLTLARIAIWNGGREPIDRSGVAGSAPLAVQAREGVRILDVRTVHESSPPSTLKAVISPDNTRVDLDFEFLNHEQGGIIEVLHTGTVGEDLFLTGIIKGTGRFQRVAIAAAGKEYMTTRKQSRLSRRVVKAFAYGFPAIFLVHPYLTSALASKAPPSPLPPAFWVVAAIWVGLLWFGMRRIKALPEGFEKLAEGLYGD